MSDIPHQSTAPVPLNQAWENRKRHMEDLIKKSFDYPISMLEIGTWFGLGSTQIWLDSLKNGSTLTLIDAWKAYSSDADLQDRGWNYEEVDSLSTDAFLSTFVNMRRFEHLRRHKNIEVQIIRAGSNSFLPLMASNIFDFIYIDGDHKYRNIKSDIVHAKRLIKSKYGVICGDDLEKLPTPELINISRNFTDLDYIRQDQFHPGVLLAISEEFIQVNMIDGFWWIFCRNGVFCLE